MNDCIFCKIIKNEIPAEKIYEDNSILAFKDAFPKASPHILVIPKKHITSFYDLAEIDSTMIAHLTCSLPKIARMVGLTNGFKTIVNTGEDGGQEIYHLHYHILGTPSV